MSGTINSPKCPYCGKHMAMIVPLVFAGDGVVSFDCKNPECKFKVRAHVEVKS